MSEAPKSAANNESPPVAAGTDERAGTAAGRTDTGDTGDSGDGGDNGGARAARRSRRDIRPWVYAGFDVAMAGLYAFVFFFVIPNRHGWVQALTVLVVLAPVVMALSMVLRRSWSWWSAVAGCGALLLLTVVFLVLTLISAAFLAGVYGSLGQAASAVALIGAALIIEFMGILPALQLKFLMTRAGRRCFGKEPLWS